MNVSRQYSLAISLLLLVACLSPSKVFGDFTEDLRANNNVAFEVLDYQLGSTYFFTNEGLDVDISNPFFGEVAIATAGVFDLATATSVEVTARVGANNDSDLILNVRNSSTSDVYVFEFSQSDFTVGEFVTLSLDPSDALIAIPQAGVVTGDLASFGFGIPFSPPSPLTRLEYTVESVRFVASVPEPSVLPVLLFACGLLAVRRKLIA